MSDQIKKFFIIVLTAGALTGCNDKATVSYLMAHPAALKQEVERCQTIDEKSSDQAERCETVMYAAASLMSIINEQQEDPEKFGQKILDAEIAYVKAQDAVHEAERSLTLLNTKHVPSTELKTAQEALNNARLACQKQQEEVNVLLAVIGMGSPE